jgi:hypothetical protein
MGGSTWFDGVLLHQVDAAPQFGKKITGSKLHEEWPMVSHSARRRVGCTFQIGNYIYEASGKIQRLAEPPPWHVVSSKTTVW